MKTRVPSHSKLRACGFALLLAVLVACSRVPPRDSTSPESPLTVTASLSTNTVHIGDVLTLRMQIRHPAGAEVHIPPLAGDNPNIITRAERRAARRLGADTMETALTADLSAFQLGRHHLTTGEIVCVRTDGTRLTQPFPLLEFDVVSVLNETNRVLQPARSVVLWPSRVPRWLWVLPLIAIAAGLAGWLAKRFLGKPRTILQMPPPEPPHEIALRALRALKRKGWIESGNVEPFYVELSAIIRSYIEGCFGIRAPELTTEEFIREAAQSNLLTAPQQELVRLFLEQADLVKFARFRPDRTDMIAAFDAAERLVRETMIPAPTEPEGGTP